MSNVLVSVVIPTKNGGKYIGAAIGSIQAQHFQQWELIIVNDGSTDNTAELLAQYAALDNRIRVYTNVVSQGVPAALNKGIAEARGVYIARLDDDDEWCDTYKLDDQLAFFETHQDHVLLGTGVIVQDEHGKELWRYTNPETDEQIRLSLLGKNCFSNATVMFRKISFVQVGGYSEEARLIEDYELWLRLGTVGRMANLPTYSTRYTVRSGNTTALHHRKVYALAIHLAHTYRHSYPGYMRGQIRNLVRLIRYWQSPKHKP